jgi:serine/threonine protein kinase
LKKIDEGAFGKIYQAIDIRRKNSPGPHVAVKFESLRSPNVQLVYECRIYLYFLIDPLYWEKGIPSVYQCGVEGEFNVLVMDLMGPSLESLLERHQKFSLKTVLMLLDQMISRIEYVHSRQIIHRDIKPDNFCLGTKENVGKLHILDFGLAKKFIQYGKHIPYREGKPLTGTARYASVNTHLGYEQSRRDDLEGIAYVSIYLYKGSLPWQGLKVCTKDEKYLRIKEKKLKTSIE